MSKGFDVNFEGIDMDPDMVQRILKNIRKLRNNRSNIFEVKTMDGTEDIVSEVLRRVKNTDLLTFKYL